MKTLPLSAKFQVVIPKAARQKLGIDHSTAGVYVKRVTRDEIVLAKVPSVESELRALLRSTPPTSSDVLGRVDKLRGEW
ncbi:MAG: hypothetical protein ABIV43_03145 [Candidatus Saccharimonadales bacterium]